MPKGLPLTASDLRAIADALDPIETDERIAANPIIGRIEVIRPDGAGEDVVGYFQHPVDMDDWIGFEALP